MSRPPYWDSQLGKTIYRGPRKEEYWQPVLYALDEAINLDVQFSTRAECDQFINDHLAPVVVQGHRQAGTKPATLTDWLDAEDSQQSLRHHAAVIDALVEEMTERKTEHDELRAMINTHLRIVHLDTKWKGSP